MRRPRDIADLGEVSTDIATYSRDLVDRKQPEVRRAIVIEGPDAGQAFDLDPHAPTRILVGTSPACEVRLTDPTVSRRHASFEPTGRGAFRIGDFDSTNGTFVDGVRIGNAYVNGGEIVRFGSTAVRLEMEVAKTDAPPLTNAMRFGKTIGASTVMRRLYPLCERLATALVPLVIEGETGTGKEVLAESMHEASGIKGPFIVFDCTTVSPALMEAELFGHERGAFTGAITTRAGVFEEADGGTILIDEIGDLDVSLQSKLLRVLDRGELKRVGGQRTIQTKVRIIAATRRDLDKLVASGQFRDDLFHRLAVARIELPPLRERHGDLQLLVRQFVTDMGGAVTLVPEILSRCAGYPWPGNIRELRNVVARYVAMGGDVDLFPSTRTPIASGDTWLDAMVCEDVPFPIARRRTLDEFERRYVAAVLARHGGNIGQAAKASGLALRYFRLVRARIKE